MFVCQTFGLIWLDRRAFKSYNEIHGRRPSHKTIYFIIILDVSRRRMCSKPIQHTKNITPCIFSTTRQQWTVFWLNYLGCKTKIMQIIVGNHWRWNSRVKLKKTTKKVHELKLTSYTIQFYPDNWVQIPWKVNW